MGIISLLLVSNTAQFGKSYFTIVFLQKLFHVGLY